MMVFCSSSLNKFGYALETKKPDKDVTHAKEKNLLKCSRPIGHIHGAHEQRNPRRSENPRHGRHDRSPQSRCAARPR